mgnify:FL=1
MKVIGVIGYSGVVGSITCDYLEQYTIVIKGSRSTDSDGKRYFRVDVDDQKSLYSFCSMCDLVINCAGPSYLIKDKVAKVAALSKIPYIDAFGCGESIELYKSNGGLNIIGAGFIPGISGIIIKELAKIGFGNTSIELYHGGEEIGGKAALMDIVKSSLNHYIKLGYCLEGGELKKYNDFDVYEYEEDFDQPIIKKLCFTEEDQQLVNTIEIKNLKDIQVHAEDFALKMIASLCMQDLECRGDDSIYEKAIEMQKKHMKGKIPWFCIKGVGLNEDGSEVITIKGDNSSYLTGLALGICARKALEMQYQDETKWLFEIVDYDFLSEELQKQGVIINRYVKMNPMMKCGDI